MSRATDRWRSRWVLAAGLTIAIAVVPVGSSFAVAYLVESRVTQPSTLAGFGAWWLAMLAVCSLTYVGVASLTRRALRSRCSSS